VVVACFEVLPMHSIRLSQENYGKVYSGQSVAQLLTWDQANMKLIREVLGRNTDSKVIS
jgi:hypothetical protein